MTVQSEMSVNICIYLVYILRYVLYICGYLINIHGYLGQLWSYDHHMQSSDWECNVNIWYQSTVHTLRKEGEWRRQERYGKMGRWDEWVHESGV